MCSVWIIYHQIIRELFFSSMEPGNDLTVVFSLFFGIGQYLISKSQFCHSDIAFGFADDNRICRKAADFLNACQCLIFNTIFCRVSLFCLIYTAKSFVRSFTSHRACLIHNVLIIWISITISCFISAIFTALNQEYSFKFLIGL